MTILSRILILSLVVLSCKPEQNKDKNKIVTFDLKNLPKVTTIRLSDLGFSDIEYIQLESNEQSMISGTDDLLMKNNLVFSERNFIIHRFTTILEFNNNGKFITRIGTKG